MSAPVVPSSALTGWALEDVQGCRECRPYGDGSVWLCGWHENLTAAARAVSAAAEYPEPDEDR